MSIGSDAHITCYSGGIVIYNGISAGKVITEKSTDGWYFKNKRTGKLIRVFCSCHIEN